LGESIVFRSKYRGYFLWQSGETPWGTDTTGLQVGKVTPPRTADGLVDDVTDTGQTERQVPQLRIALRDAAEAEIQVKTINPRTDWLLPGESAHFTSRFERASDAATGVVVAFRARPLDRALWQALVKARYDHGDHRREPVVRPGGTCGRRH
jgi:hypothetical protein